MNANESLAVFAIASTVIMSFGYYLILDKIKAANREIDRNSVISLYIWRKISGFLILGCLPAIIGRIFLNVNLLQTIFTIGETGTLWLWITGVSVLLILLNLLNSKSSGLREVYPELHLLDWNAGRISIAAGGWILYLTGYEFLFRGLLLFSCYHAFGLWPAIVINLALYSALHLPKGMKEAIAALPFGAFLCYLTLQSHSILPAIFIHSLQAISCDIFCIYRNPEMNFHLLKRNKL